MKKLFLLVFLLVVSLAFYPQKAYASSISIEATPAGAKVGDKVNIDVKVSDLPFGDNLYLYISDSVIDTKHLENAKNYLKARWTPPETGGSQSYWYLWDTAAAKSNPGTHYIMVVLTTYDPLVIPQPEFGIVAFENHVTYNLAAADDSTGTGSGTGTGNGTGTGTGTGTGDGTGTGTGTGGTSKVAAGFNLGDLGTITFLPTKVTDAKGLIVVIVNWMLSLMGALAVIALMYSGFMYITAGSDTAKAEAAKKNITWAIIGIVLVLLALVIVTFISGIIK